jgi:hypothetical protein
LLVIPHPLIRFMGLVILGVCCISNITSIRAIAALRDD